MDHRIGRRNRAGPIGDPDRRLVRMGGMESIAFYRRSEVRLCSGIGAPWLMEVRTAGGEAPPAAATETPSAEAREQPGTAQILAVASCGDRAAFAALFAHFAPRVKAYMMRLGANAAVAEDLAQETMLTVWRKASYFDPRKAQGAAWIFAIARNLRIDALRRERHPEVPVDDPIWETATPPAADDRLAMARREQKIRLALTTLPEEQALVVHLSFFQDKPHREIERDLGIPLGTVKSRLRLAMSRLRSLLGEEE